MGGGGVANEMGGGTSNGGTAPGGSPATGAGGAVTGTTGGPVIPAVTAECPTFEDGTVTFMGLAGVQIAAGAKPASPTAPLVFYWHGTGSTSGEFSALAAPVAAGVKAQGGVLVSFQNTTGGDLYSGLNVFGESDLKLVDQLAACAVRDHNVDPKRIYTMGCSAGGLFAASMAALRSSYVAAAAPNSGGWVKMPTFEDAHTPALMTVHGLMGKDVVIVDFADRSAIADAAFKMHGGFVIDCDNGRWSLRRRGPCRSRVGVLPGASLRRLARALDDAAVGFPAEPVQDRSVGSDAEDKSKARRSSFAFCDFRDDR